MARCKRTKTSSSSSSSSMDSEISLPEEVIQQIQFLLQPKQAAQTALISKSWLWTWQTRPDLDFSSSDFPTPAAFWEWARNTIRKHEQANLTITSFRLNADFLLDPENRAVADNLIARAMKMGPATFTIHLSSQINNYDLPAEVLASETLTRLSLRRCAVHRRGEVKCSKLESLRLQRVTIEGDVLWDIISRGSHSIREMVLCQFHVFLVAARDYPTLTPYIDFNKTNSNLKLISLCQFHRLTSLVIEKMTIDSSFFDNFATTFPCLKDFSANYAHIEEEIKCFSPSLERVTFLRRVGVLKAKFDFPNLLKFTFLGPCVPKISFQKPSKEKWDFDMTILCSHHPYASWFLNLKRFFAKLRLSRISLSLKFRCTVKDVGAHRACKAAGKKVRRLVPAAEVENLTVLESSLFCSTLLDCMFQKIQPRFINYHWANDSSSCLRVLCEKLLQLGGVQVEVERFQENIEEWQPMPMGTLLDCSEIPEIKQKIRFCLKWE